MGFFRLNNLQSYANNGEKRKKDKTSISTDAFSW